MIVKMIVLREDIRLHRDGVDGIPIPHNGEWILPLGWEDELDKLGIDFQVLDVEIVTNEII